VAKYADEMKYTLYHALVCCGIQLLYNIFIYNNNSKICMWPMVGKYQIDHS
jgi:hypothetical protein